MERLVEESLDGSDKVVVSPKQDEEKEKEKEGSMRDYVVSETLNSTILKHANMNTASLQLCGSPRLVPQCRCVVWINSLRGYLAFDDVSLRQLYDQV